MLSNTHLVAVLENPLDSQDSIQSRAPGIALAVTLHSFSKPPKSARFETNFLRQGVSQVLFPCKIRLESRLVAGLIIYLEDLNELEGYS